MMIYCYDNNYYKINPVEFEQSQMFDKDFMYRYYLYSYIDII